MIWIAIGVGGALDAMARHGLTVAFQGRFSGFPVGLFVVNVLGCLAIGLFAGVMGSARGEVGEVGRAFLVVGVLGGFTTFSSFGLDTFVLARSAQTVSWRC